MLRPQVTVGTHVAWGLGWGLEDSGDGGAFWQWGDNPGYKSFTMAPPCSEYTRLAAMGSAALPCSLANG
jgi:hypothetical protein